MLTACGLWLGYPAAQAAAPIVLVFSVLLALAICAMGVAQWAAGEGVDALVVAGMMGAVGLLSGTLRVDLLST